MLAARYAPPSWVTATRQLASLGVLAVPSMTGHRTGFSLCVKGFLYIFLFTLPQKAMRQAL